MVEDNNSERIYQRIISAIGDKDVGALKRLIAADIIDHNPVPGQSAGLAGFIWWMEGIHSAFPDITGRISDTVVGADKIAGRVLWSGTHEGEFLGIPGTGKTIEIEAFHIVRFADNLAAEWWGTPTSWAH